MEGIIMVKEPFFKVQTYRELKPGYEVLPIFYSPDGKVVSKNEATIKNAEISYAKKEQFSKRDIEKAINDLSDVLCYRGKYSDCRHNFDEVTDALEKMATDSDLKYKVGVKVLNNSIRNNEHLNYWGNMDWAIKMLGESGKEEAIDILTDMCAIDNEGPDHNTSMNSTADNAKDALEKIVDNHQELQLKVWIGVLRRDLCWPSVKISAAKKLAELGNKDAIRPLLEASELCQQETIRNAIGDAIRKLTN
jgi:hypothetical protein